MSLNVNLPSELDAALQAEAVRRGQTPERLAADLLAAGLLAQRAPHDQARRKLAFAAIGASTTGHNAVDAAQMLAEGFGQD